MNPEEFTIANKLHVLLLVETSAPVRFLVPTLQSFKKSQIQVTVATVFARGALHELVEAEGFAGYSLGCACARDYPRAVWRLACIAKKLNVHVIFAIEPICGALAGIAHRLLNAPRVLFSRQHVSTPLWKQALLSRTAASLAERVISVSEASAQGSIRLDRVSAEKVHVVYSGVPELRKVDASETLKMRGNLGIAENGRVIVMVARLRPEKGHLTIMNAMKDIEDRIGPVHLILVGSGPTESSLRSYARSCGSRIHFVGHQQDVAPWYALANVVVMPSLREAFGLVAAEAFFSQRPLIASGVGGLLEIIKQDETGLLVPPSDEGALSSAVVRLFKDDALADRLIRNAYSHAKKYYSISAMVDGWSRHCIEVGQNTH